MTQIAAAEAVGFMAGFCSMASFAPQLLKIWREKDARAISLRMYVVTVTGFSLWVAYGAMIGSPPVIAANSVCLALAAAILVLKRRYSRRARPVGAGRAAH